MLKISSIKLFLDVIVYTHSFWCAILWGYSIFKKIFRIWIGNKKIYTSNQHIHIIAFSITNHTNKDIEFLSCECSIENTVLKPQIPYFNRFYQELIIDKNSWENFIDKKLIKDVYPFKPKVISPNEKLFFKLAFDCRNNHIDISKLKLTIKTTLGIRNTSFFFFQRVKL